MSVEIGKHESSVSFKTSATNKADEKCKQAVAPLRETTFFRDGVRKIDFVLVYDISRSTRAELRQTFETNLVVEGLETEVEPECASTNGKLVFVKIHVPWEVLIRYAEMTGLQMPMIVNDIESAARSRKRQWIKHKSKASPGQLCVDFYPLVLRLIACLWKKMLPDEELVEPTPYFLAPYNDSRRAQFLLQNTDTFFKETQRIFIAWEILRRTSFDDNQATGNVGIYKLLNMKVYSAAFPLHDGPVDLDPGDYSIDGRLFNSLRMKLDVNWANANSWYKHQPINLIREYLGDPVGLYFCFVGFYTGHLIIPSIVGLLVCLFGLITFSSKDVQSDEICGELGETVMCPTCDRSCDYWRLGDSCLYSRLTYLFDNYTIVVLAVLASVWPNLFMVLWERKENALRFHWDMETYETTEQVRPEFEIKAEYFRINPVTKKIEPYMTKLARVKKTLISFSVVVLLLTLACGIALGVITYRIVVTQFYAAIDDRPLEYAKLMAATSGSVINLFIISILDIVYYQLAKKLTAWENHRTESEHERSLTFKLFLFQCVNYYSAIVYIALFKGKLIGRPGAYTRVLGVLRAEECDVAGCFIEFSIMCITVMSGKQIFALFYEIILYPYVISKFWTIFDQMDLSVEGMKAMWKKIKRKFQRNQVGVQYKPQAHKSRWEKDYELEALPEYGLLYEYLELAIQYGFVTLFLVGFPLAPLFALINNLIEIQVDSHKILASRRRSYLVRSHGIGIWFTIFKAVSKLSIFVNAVILAWTSDIINKFLYLIGHCNPEDLVSSPHLMSTCRRMWDGEHERHFQKYIADPTAALRGYVRYTLSKFDVNDWEPVSRPLDNGTKIFGEEVRYCFYKDFRHGPKDLAKYELTKEYWHVLASKLAFVVCFEQTMILLTSLLTVCIPVRSKSVEAQRQRAKFLANEAIHDLERERSRQYLHQRKQSALNRINFDDPDRYQ